MLIKEKNNRGIYLQFTQIAGLMPGVSYWDTFEFGLKRFLKPLGIGNKLLILLTILFYVNINTTDAQITEETYKRAEYFLSGNIQKEVYHLEVIPNWLKESGKFWHVTQTKEGKRFMLTSLNKSNSQEYFDHEKLGKKLSEATSEPVDGNDLPFDAIEIKEDNQLEFKWKNKKWLYWIDYDSLSNQPITSDKDIAGLSPDGKWRAFVKNYNLFVENLDSGEEIQLSINGKRGFEYASNWGWIDLIEGENGERPENLFVKWSPDSRKILTQITDLRLAKKMYLLDFTENEKFRPKLLSYYRGSPGDNTVVKDIPVIFDLVTHTEKHPPLPDLPHFLNFSTFWLDWSSDSQHLFGWTSHRGYKKLEVYDVNASSAEVRTVVSDSSGTSLVVPARSPLFKRLSDGTFLFHSRNSGWNHLYRYEWANGKLINPVTQGNFEVLLIHHVDEINQWIYFTATEKEKDCDVYFPFLYKVKYDGSELTLLTPENAFHEIHLSPDNQYFVDNYSTVSQATKSVLRELSTGNILLEISEADAGNLYSKGYQAPTPFSTIGKDGETDIFGVYFVPTHFDSSRMYPVIDYTYTGPQTYNTPKTFKSAIIGHQQAMAEIGFVVVTVDGLGTAGRSVIFREHSYRNLGDGTTDHVLAIKDLASRKTFLDLDRVGIFGHSAGGYDVARAMLLHPDFFKVGVASAGNHDHRMEKAWWPEKFMGYPVGDFYNEQSNISNAHLLKGRLLLAHGAIDNNVNPSATYKFAEALIAAGKDFDLFIWPGRDHNFGRPNGDYFTKKRWDYFIQHLLGETPLLHHPLGGK